MSVRPGFVVISSFLASIVLGACGTTSIPEDGFSKGTAGGSDAQLVVESGPMSANSGGSSYFPYAATAAPAAGELPSNTQSFPDGGQTAATQLIIKQGQIHLLVKNTDIAIGLLMQVASDAGGYIVSNKEWEETIRDVNYKSASYTLAVPVDQFETAMQRIRGLGVRVLDESATGEDVTDQYVDLDSRLRNLEATRDRIREFMAQAQTVSEALQVNDQLSAVEAEIEQVQGRMRYLAGRSAFSTIAIQLDPVIPDFTPAPTPTATPTPAPEPWNPGHSFTGAGNALVSVLQTLAEIGIWLVVLVLPLAVPWVLIYWLIRRIALRKTTPHQ